MAKKIFTYRGKTIEELKALSIEDFMKLLPSRQRRSFARGYTDAQKVLLENVLSGAKNIKTHCREFIIIPVMVGTTIGVHTGKTFEDLTIIEEMIGHRLGEFALTRKRTTHSSPGIGATKSSGGK